MAGTADSCLGGGDDERWPPGFRFHPTDEELVLYYLKRKICKKRLKLDIIRVLDVYKWDPEDLPGQSILRTGDRQWFFFTPRDRKYPNGARSNRATGHGYWKATGKDRIILCNSRSVGIKKTLVFYRGRSPNGERTDWVMHEYTLDEEEIKRCSTVHDYYALYKVFKKSGPGPKNGEQYGAPFKEEDWLDDDNNPVTPQDPVKKHNETILGDNSTRAGEVQPLSKDLEELMRQITDENALDQHRISDNNYVPPQVAVEQEAQSTLVDPSFREVIFPEPDGLLYAASKQENKLDNFEFNQSATSEVQLHEAQEVTSGTSNSEWVTQPCEEDFLEIADLIGPKPVSSTIERAPGNLQSDEFDGLSELDLYHDAAMFWHDIASIEQETISHLCVDSLGNHMVNNVGFQMQSHLATNQVDCQLDPHPMANHVDYQLEPHEQLSVDDYLLQSQLCGPDQINNQLWVHDQSYDVFSSSEAINETLTQPNLGVVYECTNSSTGANENQNGKDSAGASGWLSSTIWSFVDSIPSAPASAADNRLVNKAFEQMSSFSRRKLNMKNTNIDAGDVASNARKSGRNKGFIFLSIFGAFCAVLWVLVGTVKVLGRSTS